MKLALKLIATLLIATNVTLAAEIKVFDFTEIELSKLEVRKVRGADNKTTYTVGTNENGNFLKSIAENAASGLGKEIKIDLNKTPFINITWKIEKDLLGIKENTKKGHDFAARVFVIKKTGATPLSNRAINYVFSSNNEVGSNWPSPYTKKSIDNVLASTKNNFNEWITVKSNVKDDIDSNGTTDTTKDISNDVIFGSIFVERALNDNMSVGIDFIPGTAEFESRSTTQTSIKTTATATSGTNKGTADVSKHLTFYLQPQKEILDGLKVFGTLGLVRADVESLVQSVSSTDKTVEQSLDGTKLGLGLKKETGIGFIKLEYSQTDYDDISTTTSNNTKVTADIDTSILALSVAKSF